MLGLGQVWDLVYMGCCNRLKTLRFEDLNLMKFDIMKTESCNWKGGTVAVANVNLLASTKLTNGLPPGKTAFCRLEFLTCKSLISESSIFRQIFGSLKFQTLTIFWHYCCLLFFWQKRVEFSKLVKIGQKAAICANNKTRSLSTSDRIKDQIIIYDI